MSDHSPIAVIDFGSQYSQLIVRRVRELGCFAKLYGPGELHLTGAPAAVILSGGPRSVSEPDAPDIDLDYLRSLGVPVLGVCYGMQLLNTRHGGDVKPSDRREYGPATLIPSDSECPLFAGMSKASQIWMSHSDTVGALPDNVSVIARNQHGTPVALQFSDDWFGIQFHPEVTHSHEGNQLLKNFIALAKDAPKFEIASFKDHLIKEIKEQVNGREVVCGVSGGVDSTVLAVLLREAEIPMRAIFVDHGLLRKNEAAEVVAQFEELGVPIELIDASERFLSALKGHSDPEEKRKIIGGLFIDVFFEAADDIELLAQGTLYPDVIESASSGSAASKIKTHHNRVDRILDLQKEGRVLEPLAELFKDEVRQLGTTLGIPRPILYRHPFPGPGLAVRCPGAITPDKLEIIREGDAIFMRQLKDSGWYDKVWQAYCALIPVRTVGVKGDERSYEFAVSLRAVISEDAMTAHWAHLPYELLGAISNEILNSVRGVNRVLYDISTKPPASIEWE
ncbi:MAG: glutamine-hydrolyzing GMP synthase [Verrucomicrobia bacterium]|nr:glutamine-hydrolyzing GMP synthase [Verrucomicrobiota bacterium]